MTVQEFLSGATATLEQANVASARLDCLILLEDALMTDRAILLAHPDTPIPADKLNKLNKQITQRAKHLPLAYIRGRVSFFGREFLVDENVLVPRPETEIMIETLKKLPLPPNPTIADIGTGSGCLAVTASLELPNAEIIATDIDEKALNTAQKNAQKHQANIKLLPGNLLSPITNKQPPGTVDVILANLPYVPERYDINQAAAHEPKHAIFAGEDGLSLYRKLWEQIADLPQRPKFILTESLPFQHEDLAAIATSAGYALIATQDLIQTFRADQTSN